MHIYRHTNSWDNTCCFYVHGPLGYLHQDGAWRNSTNHLGRYTGFFETHREAEMAMIKCVAKDMTGLNGLNEEEAFSLLKTLYFLHGKDMEMIKQVVISGQF